MRGGQATDDHSLGVYAAQMRLKPGSDKGCVHGFLKDHFIRSWGDFRFELSSARVRAERAVWFRADMADMDDGLPALAPMTEQHCGLFFGGRIIARAPKGIIKSLLDINQDQGGRHWGLYPVTAGCPADFTGF